MSRESGFVSIRARVSWLFWPLAGVLPAVAAVVGFGVLGERLAYADRPELEIVFDANAEDDRTPLAISRDGKLFTVFQQPDDDTDRLLFLDGATLDATRYDRTDTRLVDWSLSNWGVTLRDFRNPSKVLGGPFGEMPELILAAPQSGSFSSSMVTDSGVIGFLGRQSNSHGLRDAYRKLPGQPLDGLPDLGENELHQIPMMDQSGRIISLHLFGNSSTEYYRHEPGSGWVNLHVRPDSESFYTGTGLSGGIRATSLDGDFVFGTLGNVPGADPLYINLYDNATGSTRRVFDATTPSGETMPALVQFSDQGDLLIAAQRGNSVKLHYFKASGEIVDLLELVPAGKSLAQLPQINYAGDVIFSADDDVTEKYTYYVWDGERLHAAIEDVDRIPVYSLSDDRQFYFWAPDGETYDLARYQLVPEPTSGCMVVAAVVVIAYWRRLPGRQEVGC